jgi:acyl carrier protein
VTNANDELDSKTQVYVSHGWESMRFSRPLEPGKQYQTYVRMLPAVGKMVAGDVYMLEGGSIIGLVGGLKFQCIPRSVLDHLLPPLGAATKRAATVTHEVRTEEVVKKTPAAIAERVEHKVSLRKSVSITSQVLAIITEECEVELSELADGNSFGDLGVDSLMQLAITGRMRENLELRVHSTVFSEHPSVGSLEAYLTSLEAPPELDDAISPTALRPPYPSSMTRRGQVRVPSPLQELRPLGKMCIRKTRSLARCGIWPLVR